MFLSLPYQVDSAMIFDSLQETSHGFAHVARVAFFPAVVVKLIRTAAQWTALTAAEEHTHGQL